MKTNCKWFKDVETLEELKKCYKKLAFLHHPDRPNGDICRMQEINAEYDKLFPIFQAENNKKSKTDKNYHYSSDSVDDFKNALNYAMQFDIDIEIIGTWIYCHVGISQKDIQKALKEYSPVAFWYSGSNKAWIWNGSTKSGRAYKNIDKKSKYGSETVKVASSKPSNNGDKKRIL